MAKLYKVDSYQESHIILTNALVADGLRVSPRDQMTYELRDVVIELSNPQNILPNPARKWNPTIAAAEFLQLVGGFSDPQKMKLIAPNFGQFMDGGILSGAYGPRLSMQFQIVLDRLREDPNTRQAVSVIWDPLHDLLQPARKDTPCTLDFVFAIRKNQLLMTTHMRSNDLWWGWTYDCFQFTQLQCTIAQMIGLAPGPYTHFVNSFHLYDRDSRRALEVAGEGVYPGMMQFPGMRNESLYGTWRDMQEKAHDIFYGDYICPSGPPWAEEDWLLNTMGHGL